MLDHSATSRALEQGGVGRKLLAVVRESFGGHCGVALVVDEYVSVGCLEDEVGVSLGEADVVVVLRSREEELGPASFGCERLGGERAGHRGSDSAADVVVVAGDAFVSNSPMSCLGDCVVGGWSGRAEQGVECCVHRTANRATVAGATYASVGSVRVRSRVGGRLTNGIDTGVSPRVEACGVAAARGSDPRGSGSSACLRELLTPVGRRRGEVPRLNEVGLERKRRWDIDCVRGHRGDLGTQHIGSGRVSTLAYLSDDGDDEVVAGSGACHIQQTDQICGAAWCLLVNLPGL